MAQRVRGRGKSYSTSEKHGLIEYLSSIRVDAVHPDLENLGIIKYTPDRAESGGENSQHQDRDVLRKDEVRIQVERNLQIGTGERQRWHSRLSFHSRSRKANIDMRAKLHRNGVDAACYRKDEIVPLQDYRVRSNRATWSSCSEPRGSPSLASWRWSIPRSSKTCFRPILRIFKNSIDANELRA